MTEEMLWAWAKFTVAATGTVMPMNGIETEDDLLIVFHERAEGPPIKCLSGRVVRRLALSFPIAKEEILWN